MIDLEIQNTESTPYINFNMSGQMSIMGKLLPEDPKRFFGPLIKWVEELPSEQICMDFKLDYINTSSSKSIIEFIKLVDKNRNVKRITLNWHYETDDLGMLEFGEVISKYLKKGKIHYVEYNDFDD